MVVVDGDTHVGKVKPLLLLPPTTRRVKANPETRIATKVHQATQVAAAANKEGRLISKNSIVDWTGLDWTVGLLAMDISTTLHKAFRPKICSLVERRFLWCSHFVFLMATMVAVLMSWHEFWADRRRAPQIHIPVRSSCRCIRNFACAHLFAPLCRRLVFHRRTKKQPLLFCFSISMVVHHLETTLPIDQSLL